MVLLIIKSVGVLFHLYQVHFEFKISNSTSPASQTLDLLPSSVVSLLVLFTPEMSHNLGI